METLVHLQNGAFNIFPVIAAALVFFVIIYLVAGKKKGNKAKKDFTSRNETYHFMYGQLLNKETEASE